MDTLFRRRAMLSAPSGGLLPAEYQQVEYLQGSGTSYLNIGTVDISNCKIECEFKVRPTFSGDVVFGISNSILELYTWGNISGNFLSAPYTLGDYTLPEKFYRFTQDGLTLSLYDENTLLGSYTSSKVLSGTGTIALFVLPRGSYYYGNPSKIRHFKNMQSDDTPVHDLYPCYRKIDNKPGMYDLVTETFFINANPSGNDFTVGPNI